jgi:hypothetical protein
MRIYVELLEILRHLQHLLARISLDIIHHRRKRLKKMDEKKKAKSQIAKQTLKSDATGRVYI